MGRFEFVINYPHNFLTEVETNIQKFHSEAKYLGFLLDSMYVFK